MGRNLISNGWSRMAGLVMLALLLTIRILDPTPVSILRNLAFDTFQRVKPREVAPAPVTIIDIDDASIAELGQWPWPRTRLAQLVDNATAGGAAAIAFDVLFSEPDRLSPGLIASDNEALDPAIRDALSGLPSNDDIFAEAIGRGRVILGQTSIRVAGAGGQSAVPRDVPHALLGPDPRPFLSRFPDLVENLPALEAAAAGRGVFSVRPDTDGVYRRVPLVMLAGETLRLGLTPELLRVATGGQSFAIRSNEAGVDGIVVARQLIRTDATGSVRPYLSHSARARYVSAADVILNRLPEGRLAGHLVLVGTSAIGLEDYRATPLGVAMAGVEVHAQLLENILSSTLLDRPNYAISVELLTTAILGLLTVLLVPNMAARWVILSTLLVLAAYVTTTWLAFERARMLIDPTYPVLATLLIAGIMTTANYLREERQRREIRGAFGQYVSPALIERLQDNPGSLRLGGETKELTLLFSDVRGFTAISESFKDDPQGLTVLMNRFLTVLSDAILDEGGTIDKFMGDAVMAFWNAPLDIPQHARAGCRAAIAMRKAVEELNTLRLAEATDGETVHRIDVGVGLNTGSCVVGNMGSDTRFDYTALGDTVNLASRLEGQSKPYGVGIVLGESTAREVEHDMAVMELDLLRVKGKQEPVRIFALLGDHTLMADPATVSLLETNRDMLAAYRDQRWDAAEAAMCGMETAGAEAMGLTGYLDLYRARIAEFRAVPPGPDWDGVYTATSK
ncbi:CHASE2 domain-containing protein [Anianabacter salinae]|uniref:CHASE2 domain-containing protein n=1 Tax=Anianabacter salinae TaxID=2851023 RepID=UPI00225DFAB0|nr:adenylate/guanylate cyclase domain-containing protein [Anianabacter salinae]MBV0911770.1 adenylate/guanylate cyclase domain-containing protein [Anianabacter salinae]